VTGEVVDMMCYVDHNAVGEKTWSVLWGEMHQERWASRYCKRRQRPIWWLANTSQINEQLAEYCGKNITVKGKLADRGGIAMIENAEIVKK